MKILPWLRFFRVVNLPTVPGDVLVGASVVAALSAHATGMSRPLCAAPDFMQLVTVSLSGVFMYMFGLAQNDILGAKTDVGRPIPEGLISLAQAKSACAVCWFFAGLVSLCPHGQLPFAVFAYVLVMTGLITAYNVTKSPLLMGLCRGVNVLLGAAVALTFFHETGMSRPLCEAAGMSRPLWGAVGVAALWTAYIWAVTKYSEGEESDPAKKQCVGFLIGALIYLQLLVLLLAYLFTPNALTRRTLLAGAAMLIALRFLKRVFPKVSAS